MEALPKVAKERMEDGSHEQPVMNEAAAGLIRFLSAHGSFVDKPRLMDWKELTWCLFTAHRQQAEAELLSLTAGCLHRCRVQQTLAPRLKSFVFFVFF